MRLMNGNSRRARRKRWNAPSVLNVGRMNNDVQQETQRIDQDVPLIDQDVPLATFDLLARAVA
jgi:hypothetical protein